MTFLKSTFHSFKDPSFRIYFIGLLFMMASVNMQFVARSQLAYDLTKSPLAVGIVGSGFAPPILLLSIFGGSISDQFDKKKIIQLGQLGMVILASIIAISIFLEIVTIYHLIVASVAQGIMWAFLVPARQSLIPDLVEKKLTVNAIALSGSGMALMTFLGPGIGGFLYELFGPGFVYIFICLLFVAALISNQFLPNTFVGSKKNDSRVKQIKEGIVYIKKNNILTWLLLIAMITTILTMPLRNLMPVLMDELFSKGADAVGLMLSIIGLGSLVGSLVFAGLKKGVRGFALIGSLLISGIAILITSLSGIFILILLMMFFIGIGDAGRRSLNNALLMEEADPEYRGRVNGVYTMNFGLMPLGTIPIAAIASVYGIDIAFLGSSLLLIIFALSCFIFAKKIRIL
ncbi:MAG: MFS transporter [Chloroflexi bacterium]|nr:MFS transporter [Chloroflexota bacterium]